MKLTAPEVRVILNSECDWETAVKMLTPVKKVFPDSRVTDIVKQERDDYPVTTMGMTHPFPEHESIIYSSKGGAPLKKKQKKHQMSLSLTSKKSGLNER